MLDRQKAEWEAAVGPGGGLPTDPLARLLVAHTQPRSGRYSCPVRWLLDQLGVAPSRPGPLADAGLIATLAGRWNRQCPTAGGRINTFPSSGTWHAGLEVRRRHRDEAALF